MLAFVILFILDPFAANELQVTPLARLLLEGGIVLVVYVGGLITIKPLTPQDMDLLRSALRKFRSPSSER